MRHLVEEASARFKNRRIRKDADPNVIASVMAIGSPTEQAIRDFATQVVDYVGEGTITGTWDATEYARRVSGVHPSVVALLRTAPGVGGAYSFSSVNAWEFAIAKAMIAPGMTQQGFVNFISDEIMRHIKNKTTI